MISTISICSNFTSKFDINNLLKLKSIDFKKNNFHNSVTCKIDNKSIKIFSNGSIQISGIKDIESIDIMIDKLYKILKDENNNINIINNLNEYKIKYVKISMIRIYYTLKKEINLNLLKDYLKDDKRWVSIIYIPERSAGLILKYYEIINNEVIKGTVMLFRTGKYSIMSNNMNSINIINNFFIL